MNYVIIRKSGKNTYHSGIYHSKIKADRDAKALSKKHSKSTIYVVSAK